MGWVKAKSFYDFLHEKPEFKDIKRENLGGMLKQFTENKPNVKGYYRRTTLPAYFNEWAIKVSLFGRKGVNKDEIIADYNMKLRAYWETQCLTSF